MKKKNWQKPKSDHNVILVVAWIRGGKYFTPCNFSLLAPDVAKKQKADRVIGLLERITCVETLLQSIPIRFIRNF